MTTRDPHWLQKTAPAPLLPYRLQGLAEYRNGLIDVIELLNRIALESLKAR
jgi:hypothetical protein